MIKIDHKMFEDYLNAVERISKKTSPLTREVLITNNIVTLRKIMLELENIEIKLLKTTNQKQNTLLILGAELELIVKELYDITQLCNEK